MGSADNDVVAALTALRDAGLATDRDALNGAWAQLTGRAGPPQERDLRPAVTPAGPTTGPCARCHQPTTRYGEHGSPLCPGCNSRRTP